jgi:hypothetical protein
MNTDICGTCVVVGVKKYNNGWGYIMYHNHVGIPQISKANKNG